MELKPDATGNVSWCANWQVNSRSVIPIFFLFWTLEFLPPLYSVVLWLWSIKVDSGHKYPVWCWWSRLNGSLSRSFLEEIVAFSFYMPENFKINLLWHLSHSIKTICLFGFPSEFITRQWSPEGKGCIYLSLYFHHQFDGITQRQLLVNIWKMHYNYRGCLEFNRSSHRGRK